MTQSSLERSFIYHYTVLGYDLPGITTEYRFDTKRRWRFDVAFPDLKIAIELEGGIWNRGRHSRGKGYLADMDKYNSAIEQGWIILRYATNHLVDNPVEVIDQIRRVIAMRQMQLKVLSE